MSPVERVLQTAGGFVPARCLLTVADLAIADLIEAEPVSVVTLASARQVDADALRRVLRLLAAHGIFAVNGEMVSHTSESRLLQSAHPQSLRSMVRMIGAPVNSRPVEHLRHSVTTGASSAEQAYPEGFWGYLAQHPEESRLFDAAMAAKAHSPDCGGSRLLRFLWFPAHRRHRRWPRPSAPRGARPLPAYAWRSL